MDLIEDLKAKFDARTAELIARDPVARELRTAIDAVLKFRDGTPKETATHVKKRPAAEKMSIDEAVIEAVKSGRGKPVDILAFMNTQLGVSTSIQSIRVRVSRLGKSGRLARNDKGWTLPVTKKETAEVPFPGFPSAVLDQSDEGR